MTEGSTFNWKKIFIENWNRLCCFFLIPDLASTKRIHTTLNKEADNATTPFYVALTPTYAVEDSDADSEERANSRERKVVRHEPPTLATIDVANRGKG